MSLPPRAQEIPTMGIRSLLFLSNLLSKVGTLSLPEFWKASNWITGTLSPSIITLTTNIGLQILGFMKNKQLRMHLPRLFSLIENILWLFMLPFFFSVLGGVGSREYFHSFHLLYFFMFFFFYQLEPSILSTQILLFKFWHYISNLSHLLGEGCYLNHPISWEKGAIKTRVASVCVDHPKWHVFLCGCSWYNGQSRSVKLDCPSIQMQFITLQFMIGTFNVYSVTPLEQIKSRGKDPLKEKKQVKSIPKKQKGGKLGLLGLRFPCCIPRRMRHKRHLSSWRWLFVSYKFL